jgi:Predicted protease with the C-terminal PDZ domain
MAQTIDERIMVTFVEDGSPARKSGIVVEDEVIEINNQNLREINNSFNDILEVMNS